MENIDKILSSDTDGMKSYEFLVNHTDDCMDCIKQTVDNIIRVDRSGQFASSAARYLNAMDPERFAPIINRLIEATINKDRDHVYLSSLLPAIWGEDFAENAEKLQDTDDNFRRIFKRVYSTAKI